MRTREPAGTARRPDTGAGRAGGETGSASLLVLPLAFGLLAAAGLVVDGSVTLTAHQQAANEAEQAARAGAQAVNVAAARAGRFTPGLTSGQQAAQDYLAATGNPHTVAVSGDSVDVTVTVTHPTRVLSLIGIGEVTATGHGRSRLTGGVTTAVSPP